MTLEEHPERRDLPRMSLLEVTRTFGTYGRLCPQLGFSSCEFRLAGPRAWIVVWRVGPDGFAGRVYREMDGEDVCYALKPEPG